MISIFNSILNKNKTSKYIFLNLRNYKLVFVISLLLVTGFLATSLASFFVSRTSLRAEISRNELPLTSDNIYSELQRDLFRPVFVSSLMSTDTFLRDWLIMGESGEEQITKYLNEIKTKYNTFTSFFVSDRTRNYYYYGGILKKISEEEPRDRWYFRVSRMKEDYEINVDLDMANKDAMTIFINYRVFDYNKNYIGATGVGLTVSAVKKLIELYQDKYNRTIYFIDKNGQIKLTGSDFGTEIDNIAGFEYYPLFKENLDPLLKNNSSSKSESSFTYKKDGQVIHTNIRYIKEFEWYLVVEQSEKETIEHIFRILLVNLGICIIITVVVLILVNLSVSAYQKNIETLRGIVPICSYCKQIRDDQGYWNKVEAYVSKHTEAKFSHSICPSCMQEHYPEEYAIIKKERPDGSNRLLKEEDKNHQE
ncbi:MAG: cache domain-containing protein [Desulfamplus sp.]|nr:cache domain-containing protein [Desulfamplus sp.]